MELTQRQGFSIYFKPNLSQLGRNPIRELDIPQYYMTFSAIISSIFTFILPVDTVNLLIKELAKLFNLPQEDR
eukprot:UN20174